MFFKEELDELLASTKLCPTIFIKAFLVEIFRKELTEILTSSELCPMSFSKSILSRNFIFWERDSKLYVSSELCPTNALKKKEHDLTKDKRKSNIYATNIQTKNELNIEKHCTS